MRIGRMPQPPDRLCNHVSMERKISQPAAHIQFGIVGTETDLSDYIVGNSAHMHYLRYQSQNARV